MKNPHILTALAAIASLVCGSASAFCQSHPSVEQEYLSEPLVFIGKVVAARDVPEPENFIAGTIYSLEVSETLKGSPSHAVEVFSENTSSRFPMNVGTSYLVFAQNAVSETPNVPSLFINACGNSSELPEAKSVLETVLGLRPNNELNATARKRAAR